MGFEPDETPIRAGAEGRRSPRLARRVSLEIDLPDGLTCGGFTAIINRQGAVILSPKTFRAESTIKITNMDGGGCRPFRVVWCGQQVAGLYKLGVELAPESVDFWGSDYQP